MRVAPPVVLNSEQRKTLEQWARSRSLPIRQVQRAQIILLAADGKQDLEIAVAVNISNQKAARWRKRFLQKGFPGLEKDATRPGRPPTITPAKVKDVVRKATGEAGQRHPLEYSYDGKGMWHQRKERAEDLA